MIAHRQQQPFRHRFRQICFGPLVCAIICARLEAGSLETNEKFPETEFALALVSPGGPDQDAPLVPPQPLLRQTAQDPAVGPPEPKAPTAALPKYSEIRDFANKNSASVTDLWGVFKFYFDHEVDGKQVRENAEGHIQIRRPTRVLITSEYLTQYTALVGCNPEQFWVFEKKYPGKDVIAHVCRNANVASPCCEKLMFPIEPQVLFDLTGLIDYPEDDPIGEIETKETTDALGAVHSTYTFFIARANYPLRVYLDTGTRLPTRIELWNQTRESALLVAEFADYGTFKLRDERIATQLPRRVRLSSPVHPGTITVKVYEFSATTSNGSPISEKAFDLESLYGSMNITKINVMDRECANPAIPAEQVALLEAEISAHQGASGSPQSK